MNQRIIDMAVAMATKEALAGTPVERVIWVPPETASDWQDGSFIIVPSGDLNAGDTFPWEL